MECLIFRNYVSDDKTEYSFFPAPIGQKSEEVTVEIPEILNPFEGMFGEINIEPQKGKIYSVVNIICGSDKPQIKYSDGIAGYVVDLKII